jgi:hypothetical protein
VRCARRQGKAVGFSFVGADGFAVRGAHSNRQPSRTDLDAPTASEGRGKRPLATS